MRKTVRILPLEISFILFQSLSLTSIFSTETVVIFLDCYNSKIVRVSCVEDLKNVPIKIILYSIWKLLFLRVSLSKALSQFAVIPGQEIWRLIRLIVTLLQLILRKASRTFTLPWSLPRILMCEIMHWCKRWFDN